MGHYIVTVWDVSLPGPIDYQREISLGRGSGRFFTRLYDDTAENEKDTLFFIHGAGNKFEDSLAFVDQLEEQYVRNDGPIGQIVLFSWPTNGSRLEYRDDASDAVPSGYALVRLFHKMAKFLGQYVAEAGNPPCNQETHLLAQSMGNQVLESMMEKLTSDWPGHPAFLREIILVGADVGEHALLPPRPLSKLPQLGERVHVYVHRRDRALWISQSTKNRFRRLGRVGPRGFDHEEFIVVDATKTDDETTVREKLVNHWYFVERKEVVTDVREVLKSTLTEQVGKISKRQRHPSTEHWWQVPRRAGAIRAVQRKVAERKPHGQVDLGVLRCIP